jgi:hypothetical protein
MNLVPRESIIRLGFDSRQGARNIYHRVQTGSWVHAALHATGHCGARFRHQNYQRTRITISVKEQFG